MGVYCAWRTGTYILYEALWGCNIAIVLVIMAVFMSKPFLVGVAVRSSVLFKRRLLL